MSQLYRHLWSSWRLGLQQQWTTKDLLYSGRYRALSILILHSSRNWCKQKFLPSTVPPRTDILTSKEYGSGTSQSPANTSVEKGNQLWLENDHVRFWKAVDKLLKAITVSWCWVCSSFWRLIFLSYRPTAPSHVPEINKSKAVIYITVLVRAQAKTTHYIIFINTVYANTYWTCSWRWFLSITQAFGSPRQLHSQSKIIPRSNVNGAGFFSRPKRRKSKEEQTIKVNHSSNSYSSVQHAH